MSKKIKYRPHKGTLIDSVREMREFDTKEEMFEHIEKEWDGYIRADNLVLSRDLYPEDDRIGWGKFRLVLTKAIGDREYIHPYNSPQCIGYCALEEDKDTEAIVKYGRYDRDSWA